MERITQQAPESFLEHFLVCQAVFPITCTSALSPSKNADATVSWYVTSYSPPNECFVTLCLGEVAVFTSRSSLCGLTLSQDLKGSVGWGTPWQPVVSNLGHEPEVYDSGLKAIRH